MTTRAYILINTEVGQAARVAEALRGMTGVRYADAVTGTYDVVAVVEAADASAIGQLVLGQLHGLPGLKNTHTLIAVG